MKNVIVIYLCCVLMLNAGCSNIEVREKHTQIQPDGKTIITLDRVMKYNRQGDQSINGASFIVDPNTGIIKAILKGQKSKGDIGENLASVLSEVFSKGFEAGKLAAK